MAVRRRDLTQAERADWASFARYVVPLADRELPPLPEITDQATARSPAAATADVAALPARSAAATLEVGSAPGGLDASSWNRLRTGKLVPARTIDLHGMTVHRAYVALHAFLLAAHTDRLRCVEIITGKGSGETGGAIRRELPIWLNLPSLRPLILAASYPHAANQGSVRVLLRRIR